MTARRKLGIGLLVIAGISAAYGVVALALPADPAWLETVARIAVLICGALGIPLERRV
jgi:hypothetical protein